jgi:hypothetical protein
VKAAFPSAKPAADPALLAWMIIDPGAAVHRFNDLPDDPGIELQRWGWFNGYLLAYIDGGAIPTAEGEVTSGMMTKTVLRMVPQKLYIPRAVLATNAMGMTAMGPGAPGAGYDVLEAKRDEEGYSPVCQVFTYDTPMPLAPADLPRSAADIMAMYGATVMPTTKYVYCLQARVVE